MSANWIQETTSTTGTGTITLAGAVDSFVAMDENPNISDGDIVRYAIKDGNNRSLEEGVFTSSGLTLTRGRTLETLISGVFNNDSPTPLNLSGSAIVSIVSTVEYIETSTDIGKLNRESVLLSPWNTNGSVSLGTNSGNGRAVDMQHMTPKEFYAVRLLYRNINTSPLIINRAIVAVSAVAYENGNLLTWSVDVTFNGSASATLAAATSDEPTILISDLIAIKSIDRTDGGAYPLLRVRTHFPDNSVVESFGGAAINSSTYNNGRTTGSGYFSTSVANLATASRTAIVGGNANTPIGVVYYATSGGYSLAAFGDSLTQAAFSDADTYGWPQRAMIHAEAANKDLIISNFAVSGMTHTTAIARAKTFLADHKPTFCAFFAWSVNDASSTTQAGIDSAWAETLDLIEVCRVAGVIPVVFNPPPQTFSLLQNIIDNVAGLPSWVITVDANTTLYDGADIEVMNPTYAASGVHFNDLGSGVLGQAALDALNI